MLSCIICCASVLCRVWIVVVIVVIMTIATTTTAITATTTTTTATTTTNTTTTIRISYHHVTVMVLYNCVVVLLPSWGCRRSKGFGDDVEVSEGVRTVLLCGNGSNNPSNFSIQCIILWIVVENFVKFKIVVFFIYIFVYVSVNECMCSPNFYLIDDHCQ